MVGQVPNPRTAVVSYLARPSTSTRSPCISARPLHRNAPRARPLQSGHLLPRPLASVASPTLPSATSRSPLLSSSPQSRLTWLSPGPRPCWWPPPRSRSSFRDGRRRSGASRRMAASSPTTGARSWSTARGTSSSPAPSTTPGARLRYAPARVNLLPMSRTKCCSL